MTPQAQPVDDDAAAGDRHQSRRAEAAQHPRAPQHAIVVEAIDDDAVKAAFEVLAREAERAQVVRDNGARLVDDARAGRPQLMVEEITTAVPEQPRVERVRE